MVDITWDIIKAGVAIVAVTYAMGILFLISIGISAIIFSAIAVGIVKLVEGVRHVIKRIFNRKFPKSKVE